MEYQKLKVKRFAPKEFKHSVDGRYWKKFENVYAQMEEGFMTQDVSFSKPAAAAGSESGLLATATGARVDVWRLQHNEVKEGEDDDFGPE